MRVIHTYDPVPCPARLLTNEEIGLAVKRCHDRMWEFAAMGEFDLAEVNEHARDRLLDALFARLGSLVGVDESGTEQGKDTEACCDSTKDTPRVEGVVAEGLVAG